MKTEFQVNAIFLAGFVFITLGLSVLKFKVVGDGSHPLLDQDLTRAEKFHEQIEQIESIEKLRKLAIATDLHLVLTEHKLNSIVDEACSFGIALSVAASVGFLINLLMMRGRSK